MATRTHVTYFSRDQVKRIAKLAAELEHDLHQRAPFIPSSAHTDAWDRIEAVRLAIKRLEDPVPE